MSRFRGYVRGAAASNDVARGVTIGLALATIVWLTAFNLGLAYYLR